ncbi:cation transporter HKT1;3-like [Gastrolobium bilobum]|uniref:cation transporter HKT1;3-like n=1 Tax=Gastrolobium bilobum TaxID=150636 RepID=UPI002AB1CAC9|nr:cation transporter HKT1;3-like [Gastrolobium bilobum]
MNMFLCIGKKLQHLCSASCQKVVCHSKSGFFLLTYFCRFVLRRANPLLVQIVYFVSLSFLGFGVLKALKPRTPSFTPKNLDLFFTSVSATTVSSMATVEMEVFSNPQLIIMTILMFIGGEVFTSMVGLHFIRSRFKTELDKIASSHSNLSSTNPIIVDQIELGVVTNFNQVSSLPKPNEVHNESHESLGTTSENLRYLSMKYLGYVVLVYLLVVHVIGVLAVSLYVSVISSAKEVLKNKGLKMLTFSVFTVVSTFSSCGFVPTNENMVVFRKNSGLLLMLIPQVLLGNTLFPPCLRFSIWFLGKFYKKKESKYILKKTQEVGYKHLLPRKHSVLLVATVFGFILVQVIMFRSMDWNSEALMGLNAYQKFIGVLFQSVNSRHTGETIVDLSTLSQAILVLFVVMMYLPPYTSFLPMKEDEQDSESCDRMKKRRGKVLENLIFSQLSYLVIFIILVCITERKKLKEDPLNFNVLNIVIEVISAYGNVGFTTGYSCDRQLHREPNCQDKWIGFSGNWSDEGKIILIIVMFFGRLKKFNMDGGKAWKLL